MPRELRRTFDSIESAHDFVGLLAEAVADTRRDIDKDIEREAKGTSSRRLEALRLASYSLEKLELHMAKSRRILNDLRSLRRLLFQERAVQSTTRGAAAPAVKVVQTAASAKPPRPAAVLTASGIEAIPGKPSAM